MVRPWYINPSPRRRGYGITSNQPDSLPPSLETERLFLRSYREGDGQEYFAFAARNRAHLASFEVDNPARTLVSADQAEEIVRRFAADWVAWRALFLGVWIKPGVSDAESVGESTLVAQIYVGFVDRTVPEMEIGYFVDWQHEGRGYVTEAARAALGFCFDILHAHRVRISCNELNRRSWRVAERLGFSREPHLRQTRRHVLLADGSYSGDCIYRLLRSDYLARQRPAGDVQPRGENPAGTLSADEKTEVRSASLGE